MVSSSSRLTPELDETRRIGFRQPVVLGGLVGGDAVRLGGEVLVEGRRIVRQRRGLGGDAAGGMEALARW